MLVFHDRMFFNARKSLALAARVDVLGCITTARRHVASHLLRADAPTPLVLLAQSDVAETLLAKQALVFAATSDYQSLVKVQDREAVMDTHLAQHLFAWLASRCIGAEKKLVQKLAREAKKQLSSPTAD